MSERDLVGYGPNPPHPEWPGDARIALNIVVPLVFHPFSRTLWTAGERHFYVRSHPNEDV